MEDNHLNLMIAGLSGQGIIMVERLLVMSLAQEGRNVLSADVPPWTHRNALTYCHIRTGEKLYSPRIPEGAADIIIAFEPLVGLQVSAVYGKEDALVIMNDYTVETRGLSRDGSRDMSGLPAHKYPDIEGILGHMAGLGIDKVRIVSGTDISFKETGSNRCLNMVMLGAAYSSRMIPVEVDTLENHILENTPPGTGQTNLKAFRSGLKLAL